MRNAHRLWLGALVVALSGALTPRAEAKVGPWPSHYRGPQLLDSTSWQWAHFGEGGYRLAALEQLSLLRTFARPAIESQRSWDTRPKALLSGQGNPLKPMRLAWANAEIHVLFPELGTYKLELGSWSRRALSSLSALPDFALQYPPEPELGAAKPGPSRTCAVWQKPYQVTIARYGAERDSFRLLECDGSVALFAVDRLSVVARPPGISRPTIPLPMTPAGHTKSPGEWADSIRLLHPRLVWVLASISANFPGRVIYLISGYRRDGHDNYHRQGRAMDFFVQGVKNASVFQTCRKLRDVGCGYYPNNRFVHVDVRPPLSGRAMWIDTSAPGQPSRYVDSWPGVVASGARAWVRGGQ